MMEEEIPTNVRGRFKAEIMTSDGNKTVPVHIDIEDCEGYFDEYGVFHITDTHGSEVFFSFVEEELR